MTAKKKTILEPVMVVASAIGIRRGPERTERPARPKLLVSVVNKGSGRKVKEILNELSAALSITFTGYGTAYSALLDYLGIGQTEKTILFSIIPEGDEERIMRGLRAQMSLYLAGKGISFTVPLAGISQKVADGILEASVNKTQEGYRVMKQEDRKYNLVIAAMRAGNVDAAMEAARSAGASGGTVIRARATDNQKAEQFVGITLLPEQEMLFILTKKERTQSIMDALSEKVGLKTPACGVIYALPVDRTAGISVADEDDEKIAENSGKDENNE